MKYLDENGKTYPHIYKITEKPSGKFYIGAQFSGKIVGKNYFTSGKFKKSFKDNPANFIVEILVIGTERTKQEKQKIAQIESEMIESVIKDGLCVNRHFVKNGHLMVEYDDEIRKKIGAARRGKKMPQLSAALKGKKRSKESIDRQILNMTGKKHGKVHSNKGVKHEKHSSDNVWNRGQTKHTNKKIAEAGVKSSKTKQENPRVGWTHSDETKEKIKESSKKRVERGDVLFGGTQNSELWSEERWAKIRAKGYRKIKIVVCPHCGTSGGGGNMTRYHFDNCKVKL